MGGRGRGRGSTDSTSSLLRLLGDIGVSGWNRKRERVY